MFRLGRRSRSQPAHRGGLRVDRAVMFSGQRVERFDERPPELLQDLAENSRVQQIRGRIRTPRRRPAGAAGQGLQHSGRHFEAMLHRFSIDPTMIAFGEENRDWGGAFAVYRGLTEALPYHRLFNAPISEAAIVGAADRNMRSRAAGVVAELMYADFMGRARRRDLQPAFEIARPCRRPPGDAGGPAHFRLAQIRRAAFADWTALVHHIQG